MYSIELEDGNSVHATMEYIYDDDGYPVEDSDGKLIGHLVPILGEDGETIPLSACLCNAHCSGECCCAHEWKEDYDPYIGVDMWDIEDLEEDNDN